VMRTFTRVRMARAAPNHSKRLETMCFNK
jgi:hypothetical protein